MKNLFVGFVSIRRKVIIFILLGLVAFFSIAAFPLFQIFNSFYSLSLETSIPHPIPEITVDSFGNANASIPIQLPKGKKGVTPELSLGYSSSQKEGLLGEGWDLSGFPSISFNPSKGIHDDASDGYSSFAGELILISPGVYHTKFESFYRFIKTGDSWVVTDRNGIKYFFGDDNSPDNPNSNANLQNESGDTRIWALNRVQDLQGNSYKIHYNPASSSNGVPLPDHIEYNHGSSIVTIIYEDRSDAFETAFVNFRSKLRSRIASIIVTQKQDDGSTVESEKLQFAYSNSLMDQKNRLASIQRKGYGPLSFVYNDSNPTGASSGVKSAPAPIDMTYRYDVKSLEGTCNEAALWCACSSSAACMAIIPSAGLTCASFMNRVGDQCINGQVGSQSFFATLDRSKPPELVWVSGSSKGANGQIDLTNYLSKLSVSNPGTVTQISPKIFKFSENSKILQGDIDGDLLTDLIVLDEEGTGRKFAFGKSIVSNLASNIANAYVNFPISVNLHAGGSGGYHQLIDLNSDGLADFLQLNDSLTFDVYFSNGNTFSSSANLNISGLGTSFKQFIDMDGNSVPDYVRMFDNPDGTQNLKITFLEYQSGNLSIRTTTTSTISKPGSLSDRFLSDSNGDGYIDLITYQDGVLYTYLSNGHSLAGPISSPVDHAVNALDVSAAGTGGEKRYSYKDINLDGINDRISTSGMNFLVEIFNPSTQSFDVSFVVSSDGAQSTQFDIDWDGIPETLNHYVFFLNNVGFHVKRGSDDHLYDVGFDINEIIPNPFDPTIMSQQSVAVYNNFTHTKAMADADGDGRSDFLRFENGKIYVSFSRSKNNSISYSKDGELQIDAPAFTYALDTNQDGRADFIGLQASYRELASNTAFVNGIGPCWEWNTFAHDYNVGVKYIEPVFTNSVSRGVLTQIVSTEEKSAEITYANTYERTNPSIANAISFNSLIGFMKPNLASYSVVTNVYSQVANGFGDSDHYIYENNRVYFKNKDDFAGMGFLKITSSNTMSGGKTINTYGGTNPNFAGLITKSDSFVNNIPTSSTTIQYDTVTSPFGMNLTRKIQENVISYQDSSILTTSQTNYSYDSYANELSNVIQVDGNPALTLREDKTFSPSISDWILTEITEVEKSRGGNIASHVEISYSNHLVSQIKTLIKPATTQFSTQSILSYDSYGNPTSIQDSNGNISLLEYDSVTHNYLTRITNSLGLEVQKAYDYVFGQELRNVDPNGNISEKSYDFYNRLAGVKYPGESDWSEVIEYTGTGVPGNEKVKKTIHDPKTGDSWTQETHDPYGRVIKSESLAVDAIVLIEDTTYYSNGILKSKTDPYIGATPFVTTNYVYDAENRPVEVSDSSGKKATFTYSGFTTNSTTSVNSNPISSTSVTKNALGEILSKTENAKTIQYSYNAQGKVTQIRDPEGKNVSFNFDLLGNKLSQTTINTGTTTFQNSLTGKVLEQHNANGSYIAYQYDILDRLIGITGHHSNGSTQNVQLAYDEAGASNGKGKLTSVIDSVGKTEFQYDSRGNKKRIRKYLNQEDLTFIYLKEYDLGNRETSITYPDGTVVHNQFTPGGYLRSVAMDSADGSSSGHPIVSYQGPLVESGRFKVLRSVGNGVQTSIYFDPIYQRPTELVTGLDSDIYESIKYEYDLSGNITKLEDLKNPTRTQEFQYDQFNRLTNAKGKYGEEDYQYTDGGNLIKKGTSIYSYSGSNHAVTQITSPQGTKNYSYDSSGLMTNRDGDALEYDPMGKLQRILTKDGETLTYDYDFTGSRIRKSKPSDGSSVVSIDGAYEISFRPGFSPLHTLYVKGMAGDLVSQLTLETANLLAKNQFDVPQEFTMASVFLHPRETFCKGISKDCGSYYQNRVKDHYLEAVTAIFAVDHGRIGNKFRLTMMILFGFCLVGFVSYTIFNSNQWNFMEPIRLGVTPILILSVFMSFNFFSCGVLPGTGEKNGDPPWVVFPSTIPADTPSISNPGNGSGGGPIGGSPVPGMIFFHPNHLGSISMATNGSGKPLSGGSAVGTSFVSYKPYGGILRTDSYGPDVFRNKYSGQEEDKETGLLFYKSRYYDPEMGRFLQADTVVNGESHSGSNLYMYVDGNPMSYRDPAGKNAWIHMFNQIVKNVVHAANGTIAASGRSIDHISRQIASNIDGGAREIGRNIARQAREIGRSTDHTSRFLGKQADSVVKSRLHDIDHGFRAGMRYNDHYWRNRLKGYDAQFRRIASGIDGAVREIMTGGTYSRNHGTRMWSLDHSIVGKFLGHVWQDILAWDWVKIIAGVVIVLVLIFAPEIFVFAIALLGEGIVGSAIAALVFTAAKLIIEGITGEEAEDGRPYNTQ
ncbi:RHS repeat-associated core domain-containing protein [Leptospira sp. WS92.C1]